MITTTQWPHRPGRRTAAVAATIAMLSVVFVAADSNTTRAATPPAELVSVIPPPDFGDSSGSSISADGGFVGFNLVDVPRRSTPFGKIRNRAAQQTEPAGFAVSPDNDQFDLVLSRDGCQLAYISSTVPITDSLGSYFGESIIVADRCAGTAAHQIYGQSRPQTDGGSLTGLAISAHGRYVAFNDSSSGSVVWLDRDSDNNGALDNSAIAEADSVAPASSPSLGDETLTDKVAIVVATAGTPLFQVYLWDPALATGDPLALTLVSAANGTTTPLTNPTLSGYMPSMTPDGRYVAFVATNFGQVFASFVPPFDQVMVRDVLTNRTVLISRTGAGVFGNGRSIEPSISADGSQIAFGTTAPDLLAPPVAGFYDTVKGITDLDLLVARSTSGFFDALIFDRVSLKPNGDAIDSGNDAMFMSEPVISSNGRWVSFTSTFNAELQNGGASALPQSRNVYVIGRPTSVGVSALDFGSLQVATTSGVLSATVSNTGISSFQPTSIAANGDFSVVGGGTCAVNAWLAPGQSCTVAVQFKPSTTGPRTGTLTLAETGFAAITASGTLSGSGSAIPVPTTTTTTATTATTTTTTTTTTIPRGSTPTTTLPKATPKIASLTITPNPGSFGTSIVGVPSPPIEFAVTSTGTRSAPISTVSIDGANTTDFTIVTNDCTGANLPPGASCGIVLVFTPTATGPRAGLLTAGSASANLVGTGVTQPTLRLLPNVVELGGFTIAVGTGFPPNLPIQVQWVGATTVFTGTTDGSGTVSIPIFVRPEEIPGPRTFAAVDQPGQFSGVTTPGLVVDPSMHPPTSQNPALPNFPSLVVRG